MAYDTEIRKLPAFTGVQVDGIEVSRHFSNKIFVNFHTIHGYFYQYFLISDVIEENVIIMALHGIKLQKLSDDANVSRLTTHLPYDFSVKAYDNIPVSIVSEYSR